MRIIENKIIPFRGFDVINLFGVLFTRNKSILTPTIIMHEQIHTMQMKELLYIPFYLTYVLEYLIKLVYYRNTIKAYYNVSFEREAYFFQSDNTYMQRRKKFYWIKRIFLLIDDIYYKENILVK